MGRTRRGSRHTERYAAQQSLRAAFIAAALAWHGEQRVTLLDVGSNEGTFVDAMMMDLQQRDRYAADRVRPVMWEPQPRFLPQLGKLAERWQGSVVDAAAWTSAGTRELLLHGESCGGTTTCYNSEGASLVATPREIDAAHPKSATARYNISAHGGYVRTEDFARFVMNNLTLSAASRPSPALVKLDVEGGEYALLPALFASRALCGRVAFVMIEWHLNKIPRSSRRAGLALQASTIPILNATCGSLGYVSQPLSILSRSYLDPTSSRGLSPRPACASRACASRASLAHPGAAGSGPPLLRTGTATRHARRSAREQSTGGSGRRVSAVLLQQPLLLSRGLCRVRALLRGPRRGVAPARSTRDAHGRQQQQAPTIAAPAKNGRPHESRRDCMRTEPLSCRWLARSQTAQPNGNDRRTSHATTQDSRDRSAWARSPHTV